MSRVRAAAGRLRRRLGGSMADHAGNAAGTTICEHTEPRLDGSQYHFRCRTTLIPLSADGVHAVNDQQIVEATSENEVYGTKDCRGVEQRATIEQRLGTFRIKFYFRFARDATMGGDEGDVKMEKSEAHKYTPAGMRTVSFDEDFYFEYDVIATMARIFKSGLEGRHLWNL
ncbi:hypothetical protein LTR95_008660 [Oleoguttula sp. CCFEE 5521]